MTAAKLPTQLFEVDPTRDTVLKSLAGAIIKIPKGSIEANAGAKAKIAFKEAYSMHDILKAGLTTMSGNKALSSGGMFMINGADGQKLKFNAPVDISVPTNQKVEGMQLYTGNVNDKGQIDWVNPVPLPEQNQNSEIANGKMIFNQKCASCHDIEKDGKAPPLAFVRERRSWQWLTTFTKNNEVLRKQNEKYACFAFNRYNHAVMNAYPELSDDEVNGIFEYIDREATRKGISKDKIPNWAATLDSCERINAEIANISKKQAKLMIQEMDDINDSLKALGYRIVDSQYAPPRNLNSTISYLEAPIGYNLSIKSEGWYNLDIPTSNLPGAQAVEIDVKVHRDSDYTTDMYLILPEEKAFVVVYGSNINDSTVRLFNGEMKFKPGTLAYLIAFGEKSGKLTFGKRQFKIEKKTLIDISISSTDEVGIREEIGAMNLDGFHLDIGKSKHFNQIEDFKSELSILERQLPHDCCCHCFHEGDSTTAPAAAPAAKAKK